MNAMPFIKKEVSQMPDCYGCTITYTNGKKEELELIWHKLNKELGIFDFATFDDVYGWRHIDVMAGVDLDKRFTKIKELEKKILEDKK